MEKIDALAFNDFCTRVDPTHYCSMDQGLVTFGNSRGQQFNLSAKVLHATVLALHKEHTQVVEAIRSRKGGGGELWTYHESAFREAARTIGKELQAADGTGFQTFVTTATSQTKPTFVTLSKFIGFHIANEACGWDDPLLLDAASLRAYVAAVASPPNPSPTRATANDPAVVFERICDYCKWSGTLPKSERQQVILYSEAGRERRRAVDRDLETLAAWVKAEIPDFQGVSLSYENSSGQGRPSYVPWICILPPGQTVSNGVYGAVCFGREGAGAVVGCAQSAAAPREGLDTVKRSLGELRIDVDGASPETKYNDAFVNPVEVFAGEFNPAFVKDHLVASLKLCFSVLELNGTVHKNLEQQMSEGVPDIVGEFSRAVFAAGLRFPSFLTRSLLLALMAKRFAILTGNSGTGKTKLAIALAHWLTGGGNSGGYRVVPVGADWTDNRHVMGYLNPFKTRETAEGSAVTYESTPVLELIQKAIKRPFEPYFLILDEMNLSHVERYFSDFLSAIESDAPIPLYTADGPVVSSNGERLPAEIKVPRNLFIVGTVNVDETTYVFSPKVLDRANVVEFKIERDQLDEFFANPKGVIELELASATIGQIFLRLAQTSLFDLQGLPAPDNDNADLALNETTGALLSLFSILQRRGDEFAFRTAGEVLRFVRLDAVVPGEWEGTNAVDRQIVQKLLPKLNGSRRSLESLLVALATYCVNADYYEANAFLAPDAAASSFNTAGGNAGDLKYPHSYRKLTAMIDSIRRDQFVSFIH